MIEAVEYLHRKEIIACNIKPNNVLFQESGWIMLSDYGIPRDVSAEDYVEMF